MSLRDRRRVRGVVAVLGRLSLISGDRRRMREVVVKFERSSPRLRGRYLLTRQKMPRKFVSPRHYCGICRLPRQIRRAENISAIPTFKPIWMSEMLGNRKLSGALPLDPTGGLKAALRPQLFHNATSAIYRWISGKKYAFRFLERNKDFWPEYSPLLAHIAPITHKYGLQGICLHCFICTPTFLVHLWSNSVPNGKLASKFTILYF